MGIASGLSISMTRPNTAVIFKERGDLRGYEEDMGQGIWQVEEEVEEAVSHMMHSSADSHSMKERLSFTAPQDYRDLCVQFLERLLARSF